MEQKQPEAQLDEAHIAALVKGATIRYDTRGHVTSVRWEKPDYEETFTQRTRRYVDTLKHSYLSIAGGLGRILGNIPGLTVFSLGEAGRINRMHMKALYDNFISRHGAEFTPYPEIIMGVVHVLYQTRQKRQYLIEQGIIGPDQHVTVQNYIDFMDGNQRKVKDK